MLLTKLEHGASYKFNKSELDWFVKLMKNYEFKRDGFETKLVSEENEYKLIEVSSNDVLILVEVKKENDDSFSVHIKPRDTELIGDDMMSIMPKDYDFGMAITSILEAVEAMTSAEAMAVVPGGAKKICQLKVLGKVYSYYRYITDTKGNPLVPTENTPVEDIRVVEFVKLEKSADFLVKTGEKTGEKSMPNLEVPVVPFTGRWLVVGEKNVTEHHIEIVVEEKDLKDIIGVNPYESSAKMWELIESGKILPLYQTNPMAPKNAVIKDSVSIIARILAENKINKAFSPTGIIVV